MGVGVVLATLAGAAPAVGGELLRAVTRASLHDRADTLPTAPFRRAAVHDSCAGPAGRAVRAAAPGNPLSRVLP